MTSDFDHNFLHISRWGCLQFLPLFIHCGVGFWYVQSFLYRTGLCTKPQWKLPTNPCRLCVQYVVASPSRMLHSFLNLTVPHCCTCLKFPSAVILLFARHCGINASVPASEEHRQSPWNHPCHRSAPRGLSWYDLLLAIWPLLLPILQSHFCFLDNFVEASRHNEFGLVVFWICVGLPFTHLYPSRNFGRKIWSLAIPIDSSEKLTLRFDQKTLMIFSETLFLLVWFFVSSRLNISMKDVSLPVS